MNQRVSSFLSFLAFFGFCNAIVFSVSNYQDVDWEERLEEYEKQELQRRVNPIELRVRLSEKRLEAWNGLEMRLKIFRDQSYMLYDPTRSPFNERVSGSSHPESFTVTSDRSALSGEYSFEVLQTAKRDRIGTKAHPKEETLSPARFQVQVGEESVEVDFSKGGTLRELYGVMYQLANKPFDVTLIPVRGGEEMLLISSKKSGLKNRILLSGDSEFLREVGFLNAPKDSKETEEGWSWKDLSPRLFDGDYSIHSSGILTLKNLTRLGISFPKTLFLTPRMLVELRFRSRKVEEKEETTEEIVQGKEGKESEKEQPKELPPLGTKQTVDIDGNSIHSASLIPFLGESSEEERQEDQEKQENKPELPPTVELGESETESEGESDGRAWIQLISSENISTKEQSFPSTEGEWKMLKLELQDLIEEGFPLRRILFWNQSKEEEYELDQLKIYDPFTGQEEYNFLERAQNAEFQLNGVELSRENNEIDDVIQGVNITLKRPGKGSILVGSNIDRIVEEMNKFLNEYNNVMLYLKNLMDWNVKPIFTFADLEENDKEWAEKSSEEIEFASLSGERYQGYMRSEHSLRSLRVQLREGMVTTPYERNASESIRFLQQIGFRDPENFTEAVDLENIRAGYLVLDEEILKGSLQSDQEAVIRLLAHSEEGTVIKNRGILVELVQILDRHIKQSFRDDSGKVQTGLISLKKKSLDTILQLNRKRLSDAKELVQKRKEKFQNDISKILQAQERGEMQRQRIQNSLNLQRRN